MRMKAGLGKPGFITAAPPVPPRPQPNAVPPPGTVARIRTYIAKERQRTQRTLYKEAGGCTAN